MQGNKPRVINPHVLSSLKKEEEEADLPGIST